MLTKRTVKTKQMVLQPAHQLAQATVESGTKPNTCKPQLQTTWRSTCRKFWTAKLLNSNVVVRTMLKVCSETFPHLKRLAVSKNIAIANSLLYMRIDGIGPLMLGQGTQVAVQTLQPEFQAGGFKEKLPQKSTNQSWFGCSPSKCHANGPWSQDASFHSAVFWRIRRFRHHHAESKMLSLQLFLADPVQVRLFLRYFPKRQASLKNCSGCIYLRNPTKIMSYHRLVCGLMPRHERTYNYNWYHATPASIVPMPS